MIDELSIPFKLDEVYKGVAEGDGILRWDGTKIVFEYQVKDAIFGVIKSQIKKFGIRIDDIQAITIKKGFFSACIMFKSFSMSTFNNFPGREMNEIKLKIKKKDFELARELHSTIQLLIAEKKLDRLSR